MANWRFVQTTEYARTVSSLPASTRADLAELYRILAQWPLPGEPSLAVLPYAAIPGAFTVPLGEEGLVVYLVLPTTRTIGLLGLVWVGQA